MNVADSSFAQKYAGHLKGRVIDVGSFDVNGALRDYIDVTIGVDMREGPGVDMVVDASSLEAEFGPESFDTVCSVGTLEHVEHWKPCMSNMWAILKTGGALLLTMANKKKGFHGYPSDYWRWDLNEFKKIFRGQDVLGEFESGPSMGVIVRKVTDALDLSIAPEPVRRTK